MTADALEYAFESGAQKQTVIIIAGDRDYCPLVKKILSKKSEWNVELLAFERSISKQMREIKSVSFKIINFEDLLQEHTHSCCYVEPRWRTDVFRIPKNRAIILRFKEPLISPKANVAKKMEVNQLLRRYAVEVTHITGVPCCYHLCNWEPHAGRWVFIIGYTWVKAEPGDHGIDFFRICKANMHQLNIKCSEICQLYETYHTAMETDVTAVNDELHLQNRFAALEVEKCTDDDLLSHIYDDEDSGIISTESSNEEIADSEGEDSDTECFMEVKSSSEARHPIRKYSSFCPYEFSCSHGRHCDYKHTRKQVDFFKAHDGKGQKGYKSKPCRNFQTGSCKYGPKGVVPNCPYYHSTEEARCYVCKNSNLALKYIGHASHDDTCPSNRLVG